MRQRLSAHWRALAFAATLAFGLVGLVTPAPAAEAPAETAPPAATNGTVGAPPKTAPTDAQRRAFHVRMLAIKRPHPGCFVADYPTPVWREIPCRTPSPYPFPLVQDQHPNTVGGGTDFFSGVTGNMTGDLGSFEKVSGLEKEFGSKGGQTSTVYPNVYSLQLNANTFTTKKCAGFSKCKGWEQFIYSQSGCGNDACVFIEYWLLNHPSPCPSTGGWNFYDGSVPHTTPGCWLNTAYAYLPVQPLKDMHALTLSGATDGSVDTVAVSIANGQVFSNSNNSIAGLAKGWTGADFNLVGDCCASEAFFVGGKVTIVVKQEVFNRTSNVPACNTSFSGTTAETNNLNLVPPCNKLGGADPAIVFTESGGGTLPHGVSVGDP